MQLLRVRFTIRSVFIAIALMAVVMAVVRSIERGPAWPAPFKRQTVTLVTLVYGWAVALFLVLRAERSGSGGNGYLSPWPRDIPRQFLNWLGLGLISPIAMMAFGIMFWRRTGYHGPGPWPANVIEGMFWLQVIHALLGVLVLRGSRGGALVLGIVSVLTTGWVALFCTMSVTGWAF